MEYIKYSIVRNLKTKENQSNSQKTKATEENRKVKAYRQTGLTKLQGAHQQEIKEEGHLREKRSCIRSESKQWDFTRRISKNSLS